MELSLAALASKTNPETVRASTKAGGLGAPSPAAGTGGVGSLAFPRQRASGAHLAVPPPEYHSEGPVSHEVPLAVLEVAHRLHVERLGGQRGGEPGSAPRARPGAAGRGKPRPRARTDAQAERPERKRGRPPRGAGVSETWARPLLMAQANVGRGALAKRRGRCRAEGTAAVTGRPRSYLRAWQRCRAGAAPSPQVRPPRLGASAGAAVWRPPPWNPHSRGGTTCLLRGSAQRTRARRPLRADYRPRAMSARLVGRRAPGLLPPPRKGVRAPGRGARHRASPQALKLNRVAERVRPWLVSYRRLRTRGAPAPAPAGACPARTRSRPLRGGS